MAYTPITARNQIRRHVDWLSKAFGRGSTFRGRRLVSWRPGSAMRDVAWHSRLGVWGTFGKVTSSAIPRYWNTFGTQDPSERKHLYQTVQTSLAVEGADRRVGAILAKDDRGRLYLLHSGNIGGGRPGIGKTLFRDNWNGKEVDVEFGKETHPYAVVADLSRKNVAAQICHFVKEVERIKALVP